MLEVSSQNVAVTTGTAIPLNTQTIKKGCTAERTGTTSIQLNKCGVYMVSFDGSSSITGTTAGNIVVQMMKNGVLQPQAISTNNSTSSTDVESLSFVTLVQVSESNTCDCCSSPTVLTFVNTGVGATYTQANVCVTKIC